MDNNKEHILTESIFNSLSLTDLKSIIQKSLDQISNSINRLADNFSKPRFFLKSDYDKANTLINSLIKLQENNTSEEWLKDILPPEKKPLNKQEQFFFTSKKDGKQSNFPLKSSDFNQVFKQASEICDKFKQDYSEILKNIQYNDIIKQKLEHISEFNNDIIKELIILEAKNKSTDDNIKYLFSLKEIINIQIAQLFYIADQYKNAIGEINKAFKEQNTLLEEAKKILHTLVKWKKNLLESIEKNSHGLNLDKKTSSVSFNQLIEKLNAELSNLLSLENKFNKQQETYENNIAELEDLLDPEKGFLIVIHDIIDNLNIIEHKLSKNKVHKDDTIQINLDFLKKRYTVNSEHKIHNLTLENNKSENLTSEIIECENNDDVEFF